MQYVISPVCTFHRIFKMDRWEMREKMMMLMIVVDEEADSVGCPVSF